MNIYYVFQGKSHEIESEDGYLWSPQKNKDGHTNKGYENMNKVKKNDVIFHGANGKTYAISIAEKDSYEFDQPYGNKASSGETTWRDKGYRVDSDYTILDTPLIMKDHSEWFVDNHEADSAFTVQGRGKQIYLSELAEEQAKYILNELRILPQNDNSLSLIETILKDVLNEELPEYDQSELEHINTMIEKKSTDQEVKWQGERKEKEFVNPSVATKKIPKRSANVAANALKIANYICEYDKGHKVFLRKHGDINYTEPHHLIPLSMHEDFDYSLDIEENIVSLCSHCHNLLHYGRLEDKAGILEGLFNERKDALKRVGLDLNSIEDLERYYR